MKKYLVKTYDNNIIEVEVQRESHKCIWMSGTMVRKRTTSRIYYDTYQRAYDVIIDGLKESVEWAENNYNLDKQKLDDFVKKYSKCNEGRKFVTGFKVMGNKQYSLYNDGTWELHTTT